MSPKIYDPRKSSGPKGVKAVIAKRSFRRRKKSTTSMSSRKEETKKDYDFLEFVHEGSRKFSKGSNRDQQKSAQLKTIVEEQNRSSSPTTNSNFPSLPSRRAIAIDTRFLKISQDGTSYSTLLANNIQAFLESANDRGLDPCILSWTELQPATEKEKKMDSFKKEMLQVRSTLVDVTKKPAHCYDFSGVAFPASKESSTEPIQIPKQMSANASWKLFGDFVDSILETYTGQDDPLNITLLTNDVSFLSDTREKAHQLALNAFWNRTKPHFLKAKLRNIQIVVLLTDSVVVTQDDSSSLKEPKSLDDQTKELQIRKRELSIVECIRRINLHIDKKGEDEFKTIRSFLQFDSSEHIPTINISLSTVENSSVGLKVLLRKWSRDKVSSTRLSFELPETMDCSPCLIALDAVYKSIPFPLNSHYASSLILDLHLLGKAKLQVEKLVPIASIDASLIYGIPIRVRPGLERDVDSHNEMLLLVQSLFHQLSRKDYALYLTSQGPDTDSDDGLFHSKTQSFLLMPEELPADKDTAPSTGTLFRVATGDHLMEEIGGPSDFIPMDTNNPFSEYVEASLDCLACSPNKSFGFNPVYMEARSRPFTAKRVWRQPNPISVEETEHDSLENWNDDAGVGSSNVEAMASQNDQNEKSPDSTDSKWNDNSGIGSNIVNAHNSDIDEDDTLTPNPKEMGQKGMAAVSNTRKTLIKKQKDLKSKEPINEEEIEWTDEDEALYYTPPMEDSTSESDTSHTKGDAIPSFDYTQSSDA